MSQPEYDLTTLSRYSYRAKAFIDTTKTTKTNELSNVLNPHDNIFKSYEFNPTDTDLIEIEAVLKAEYIKPEAELSAQHLVNIYFLLLECFLEIKRYSNSAKNAPQAKALNDFFKNISAIRKGNNKYISITINDGKNPAAKLELANDSQFLNFDFIDHLYRAALKERIVNPSLFEAIDLDSILLEPIQILPEIVATKEFQIAHYALLILKYLNVEVTGKTAKPEKFTNIQRRAVFELLRLAKLSDLILDDKVYSTLTDGYHGNKKNTVTYTMKKFLENHLVRKHSSYKLTLKELA